MKDDQVGPRDGVRIVDAIDSPDQAHSSFWLRSDWRNARQCPPVMPICQNRKHQSFGLQGCATCFPHANIFGPPMPNVKHMDRFVWFCVALALFGLGMSVFEFVTLHAKGLL